MKSSAKVYDKSASQLPQSGDRGMSRLRRKTHLQFQLLDSCQIGPEGRWVFLNHLDMPSVAERDGVAVLEESCRGDAGLRGSCSEIQAVDPNITCRLAVSDVDNGSICAVTYAVELDPVATAWENGSEGGSQQISWAVIVLTWFHFRLAR